MVVQNVLKILFKELRVAILCGTTLAITTFAKIILIDHFILKIFVDDFGTMLNTSDVIPIALAISLTVLLTIISAKLVGCLLPILAKRIKLDPAVMASPLITTIVDVLSLLIYFGIASAFVLI